MANCHVDGVVGGMFKMNDAIMIHLLDQILRRIKREIHLWPIGLLQSFSGV
jgi:hypothetical protein